MTALHEGVALDQRPQQEHAEAGLTVLLVDIAEPRETVARAVTARGYSARVLLDPEGRASDAYRVQATPTVYLVGRDGR